MNHLKSMLTKNFEHQLQKLLTEKLSNSSIFRFFALKTHQSIQEVTNPEKLVNNIQNQRYKTSQSNKKSNEPGVFSVLKEEALKELKELNPLSGKDKKDRL